MFVISLIEKPFTQQESLVDKDDHTIYTKDSSSSQAPFEITSNSWNFTFQQATSLCEEQSLPQNLRSHNAHLIYSRAKMRLEAFQWQMRVIFCFTKVVESPLRKSNWNQLPRLAVGARKKFRPTVRFFDNVAVLYTFQKASKDENGQSTFMKKSFLQEYPQKKLDY